MNDPTREQARELNSTVMSLMERLLEKHTFAVLQAVHDEISARDDRLAAARKALEDVRTFHFANNPPNTGLAGGFNHILRALDGGANTSTGDHK